MNIYFRADANNSIGMGHIMRSLSIADAASSQGCDVIFILADDRAEMLVNSRGYKTIILHTDYTDMESEIPLWSLRRYQPDIIIIDSYYVTEPYLCELKNLVNSRGGKLIYLDDVLSFPYPVDVLIDYNAYADRSSYQTLYANGSTCFPQLIVGVKYVPLRSMFRNIPEKVQNKVVKNILISTGGSDELHISISLAKELCEHQSSCSPEHVYHFLIGAMNEDKDRIKELVAGRRNFVIHENVADMRELISSCDITVSAAGSTLYEIAACGVPLITYSLADNQLLGAQAFSNLGLAMNIGDLRNPDTVDSTRVMSGELDSSAIEKIIGAIEQLSRNYNLRVDMGKKTQELIDGYGADRLVKEIVRIFRTDDRETSEKN